MTASTENSTTDAASSTEATETTSATPYVDYNLVFNLH